MQEFIIFGVGRNHDAPAVSSVSIRRPWRIASNIPDLENRFKDEAAADGVIMSNKDTNRDLVNRLQRSIMQYMTSSSEANTTVANDQYHR